MLAMYYYEVFVSSPRYHGADALTYSSEARLPEGLLVKVSLGKHTVSGFVARQVAKPGFNVKPIDSVIHPIPLPHTVLNLFSWLGSYYPSPSGFLTQLIVPSLFLSKPRKKPITGATNSEPTRLPRLTTEQQNAVNTVRSTNSSSVLLHGETGSGKTRVYLELASQSLTEGKSVMVLTPEIGLTPQLVQSFEQVFPARVITIHSGLTQAQRRDAWLKIHESHDPIVVIGPRSALFVPLKNIGLIVVDEAHDPAYKQEQAPYYQTTRVAAKLASLGQAKVLFGTATPLVQDYFAFTSKGLPIIRMRQMAIDSVTQTDFRTVDMTKRDQFTKSAWLSDELVSAINTSIGEGSQVLLFLNRRGTARLVVCASCGWQALCPHCDVPLTYHGDTHSLRCHTCGYNTNTLSSCPVCKSAEILFRSVGTKTIASEAQRLFPDATIQRFDTDNKKSESLEENYADIAAGKADILVGTQMLGKGLDLPKLVVVGIINADTGLSFPDFTAEERTYQMLRQVIGRVGRGHNNGMVVVQTFQPNRESIIAALERDYDKFYKSELAERELYHFPPYYYLLKVHFDRSSRTSAMNTAQKVLSDLLQHRLKVETMGPAPAFTEKVQGKYRWQIVLKSKSRTELTRAISLLPKNCTYDIDPSTLL